MEFAFDSFTALLQMGKHGLYVWLCYALSAFTILGNIVLYRWNKKQIRLSIRNSRLREQKQKQNYLQEEG